MARAKATTTEKKPKAAAKAEKVEKVAAKPVRTVLKREDVTRSSLAKAELEYAQYRIKLLKGTETNTAKAKQLRHDIARMQTFLNTDK